VTMPCASPSVPASRFHTAIHGVRLCLGGGIHDRRGRCAPLSFNPNLTTRRANSLQRRNFGNVPSVRRRISVVFIGTSLAPPTHPAKTFRWHRAIGHQFEHHPQDNALTRFEHHTLECLSKFRRA
jgi:hypothetical protein